MVLEQLMEIFSDVSLPALQTATGVTEDVGECCGWMQGPKWATLFLAIRIILCFGDAGTNLLEFHDFNHSLKHNITEPHQMGYMYAAVDVLPYLLLFSVVPAFFRVALTFMETRLLWKLRRSVGPTSAQNSKTFQECLLIGDIISLFLEFIIEILGVSIAKLVYAFKSIAALQSMMSTSSKVSNGVALALAIVEYGFLCRRAYVFFVSCRRGKIYALSFPLLFLIQSISFGTTAYAFAISLGVVDIDVYDKFDFYANFGIVLGVSVGSFLAAISFISLYHCIFAKPQSTHRQITVSPA